MSDLVSIEDIIKNPINVLRENKYECRDDNCIQKYISIIQDGINYNVCLNCLQDKEYIEKKIGYLCTDKVFKPMHECFYEINSKK